MSKVDRWRSGNCYYSSEALYHILGGKKAGWTPMYMEIKEDWDTVNHWFLKHKSGIVLDASKLQFHEDRKIDYTKAQKASFKTKTPSKKAKLVMTALTWENDLSGMRAGEQW